MNEHFDNINSNVNELYENQNYLNEEIAKINKKNDNEQIDRYVDGLKGLYSSLWSSAAAYTNLIVIAGYAGFFGLISLVKEHVAPFGILLSSFFIALSLAIFVIYEIYKMVHSNLYLKDAIEKATRKGEDVLDSIQKSENRFSYLQNKVWIYTFIPTVLFGLLGVTTVLVSVFISWRNMLITCVG
ncbi:hypothetical protein [Aeromonas hydrophila]|uniref:hypothetical protein n=1 Tax=Aeromonas hydrophila TaxID=644 RepID=UPI001115A3CE|nr:hypothetical protein [Aeromonas hydrophila]